MPVEGPWVAHARGWSLLGAPLRPSPEDVRAALSAIRSLSGGRAEGGCRALLLGVTPELATMEWPAGTTLVAVDRSEAMLEAVFPRVGLPEGARAILGEWESLPVETGSVDVVIGDGCLSMLEFPQGARRLGAEVRRALSPGGLFVIRAFAAPEDREEMAAIEEDLRAGAIGSFHALKWRVAMALQASAEAGVVLDDVYTTMDKLRPILAGFAERPGFEPDVVGTIEAYRGSPVKYWFPSVEELRGALSGSLVLERRIEKTYELGDRCPTLVFRRRSGG